ncbi:MAG TPA: Flp pilus assembly protein CpaB [Anaerolineae bacterium]|jgi:Flp pilus assembly protein CpaB|nr:Flp pilus assembly protein CpaB [Anaerolineae bacterium]
MRGGRTLVLIGLIVLLGAVAVGVILWRRGALQPASTPPSVAPEGEEAVPFAPLEGMREIVVAAQNIPRGNRITSDAVQTATWPETSVPEGALADVEEVLGRVARVDIVLDMPILDGMLTDAPGDLGAVGSDAALQIPAGKVAFALPVSRYSGVAWAIRPGDHVDVIVSLLVVELDEEFQTALPNNAECVQPPEGEGCQGGVMGRLEVLPNSWVVNLTPNGDQRPRLVTQLTVQDAVVLRIGDWPGEEEAPPVEEEQPEEVEGQPQPVPSSRAAVEPLTLIVTPQDAMVLKYAGEIGASIDLVLRSSADTGQITTDSVTLQYIFERFEIELPPKLPYGLTPPLRSLRSGVTAEVVGGGGGEAVEE